MIAGMREAEVLAAQFRRHRRVTHRQSLDVRLVDHRLVQRRARQAVVAPVEARVDDDGARHVGSRVGVVDGAVRVAEPVRKHRLVPLHAALDGARVRVQQQLARMTPVAAPGVVRAVHAEAVRRARPDAGHVAVPAIGRHFRQRHAGLPPLVVEEAQVDLVCGFREDREIRAGAVVHRPEWIGTPGPDLHTPTSVSAAPTDRRVSAYGRASNAMRACRGRL